jgi:hypothetical protein
MDHPLEVRESADFRLKGARDWQLCHTLQKPAHTANVFTLLKKQFREYFPPHDGMALMGDQAESRYFGVPVHHL